MEIFNKDTSNPDNIELMDHAKRPLSSDAVLDEGWRDASKELPKDRAYTTVIIAIKRIDKQHCWSCQGRYDGWSKHWEDFMGDTIGIDGDNLEVYAWRPLPDPPAFV